MLGGKTIFKIGGPLLFLVIIMLFGSEGSQLPQMTGILVWMAIWWISECVPLSITSLLPLVLFPVMGISSTKDIAPLYMNHIIFLFAGGFLLAFAIEKWDLHKRIALKIIGLLGNDLRTILLGFMLASFLLSMWISNIATTMVMIPTVLAITANINIKNRSSAAAIMLLATAYASSIGGTASLTGTAPNLICYNVFEQSFPEYTSLSFSTWLLFGVPTSGCFLIVSFLFLKRSLPKGVNVEIIDQVPPKMGYEEKVVAVIFSLVALLWFTRQDLVLGSVTLPGWSSFIPYGDMYSDATVVLALSTLLFIIPSKSKPGAILEIESVKKIPFDILLLFGGGFALAQGINDTGLAAYMGEQLLGVQTLPLALIVAIVITFMTFLTEFTSNTATSQLILPLLAAMAVSTGIAPHMILIPATFAASFAFMLPIATPPNTIVFGTGEIPMKMMVRKGLVLNIIGIVIMTISMMTLGQLIFG